MGLERREGEIKNRRGAQRQRETDGETLGRGGWCEDFLSLVGQIISLPPGRARLALGSNSGALAQRPESKGISWQALPPSDVAPVQLT